MGIDGDNYNFRAKLSGSSEVEVIHFPWSLRCRSGRHMHDLFEQRLETPRLALESPQLLRTNDVLQIRH
jgi:hypothetical protein